MTYRILLVDDRNVVREQLRNLLELTGTVVIVGEASDGLDGFHQAVLLKPDIVLMDLEMPGIDGFEATYRIKKTNPAQVVIIFTVYIDEINKQKALESGADAFIAKGTDWQTLLDLFHSFMNRESDPSIAEMEQ